MGQIDAILKFASAAAAKADPDVQQNYDAIRDLFAADRVVPVRVWRASQDVAGVHTFLTGFFVLISLPRVVASLRDNAAIQLVIDRDKANARQPGAIIRSTVSNAVLQDIRISPVFAGSDYPWGGFN